MQHSVGEGKGWKGWVGLCCFRSFVHPSPSCASVCSGQPPVTPADLPAFDASGSSYLLEMQLSAYTFLTAIWTFENAGGCYSALVGIVEGGGIRLCRFLLHTTQAVCTYVE